MEKIFDLEAQKIILYLNLYFLRQKCLRVEKIGLKVNISNVLFMANLF